MRREFATWLQAFASRNDKVVVLTGDLGFQALEGVRDAIGARFVNMGVSEQNMMSVAAGLASEGLLPFCYSIAPFAVFRPAEQIRLDICIHGLGVKIVGNGGGYGYGIMGATHHALEDIAVMSSFPGLSCFVPATGADVGAACDAMMLTTGPSYLRLNLGTLPGGFALSEPFASVRRIVASGAIERSAGLTVVGLGPSVLNALAADVPRGAVDWFVVSQLPVLDLPSDLIESVRRSGRLLMIEEHVERGGLSEHLALALLQRGLAPQVWTRSARGYPTRSYGSQQFHQRESGLDAASLGALVRECLNARS